MRWSLSLVPLLVTRSTDKDRAPALDGEAKEGTVFRDPEELMSPLVILILCLIIFLIKCRD